MDGLAAFALGPLLYLAVAAAANAVLEPIPESLSGTVAAAVAGSILAVLCLARAVRGPLGLERAFLVGLLSLVAALALGSPGSSSNHRLIHAALLLASAAALGESFATVIEPRLRQPSVLVTAAICLALFDAWSVLFGPAASAAQGGFLQRLLLDAPAPGGPIHLIGISDLVVIALLAGLARLRGWGTLRAFAAGLLGLEAALVQALLTRHPAPALPWIGLAFCAVMWRHLRPDGEAWRRTGRWAAGSTAALVVLTGVLRLVHRG